MFEQTFVEGVGKTNRVWTVMISFFAQILALSVAVLLPMIYFDVLPRTQLTAMFVAPPPPPPPPPPPAAASVKMVKVIPRQFDAGRLTSPKVIPKDVTMIKEEELPPPSASAGVVGGVPGGVPGGTPGGVIGGIIGAVPTAAPPPPPVEVKKPTVQRIRVGGQVQQANLIRQPKPVYPPPRKQARIQGVVRFNAIIGKDGTIQNLTLMSGHPLLVPSAQEAVKTPLYTPTLLNGEPVEVATVIDVKIGRAS